MPKRKRGLTTDEIQKVLADLEDEVFDDSDSDCELENEGDDLISAQQKVKVIRRTSRNLNDDQVTRTIVELEPPLLIFTPRQRKGFDFMRISSATQWNL
ncbi:hypothetical protein TNCV_2610431 [Trichonephila clavipes]|nr:hypothetical protein TNCV_2610431 [Trichonephila clavipes]